MPRLASAKPTVTGDLRDLHASESWSGGFRVQASCDRIVYARKAVPESDLTDVSGVARVIYAETYEVHSEWADIKDEQDYAEYWSLAQCRRTEADEYWHSGYCPCSHINGVHTCPWEILNAPACESEFHLQCTTILVIRTPGVTAHGEGYLCQFRVSQSTSTTQCRPPLTSSV